MYLDLWLGTVADHIRLDHAVEIGVDDTRRVDKVEKVSGNVRERFV